MAWNQPNFAPPPGINFNAPVIRMGGGGGGGGRGGRDNAESMGRGGRMGLGADRNLDRQRQEVRESMMALQPPTREEVARTIFIGGLGEGTPGDDILQDLLACAGKLRRWTRAKDADDKKCKFGFAEYEDVESLEAAAEILKDVQVPLFNADGTVQKEEGEDGDVKKSTLLVVVDQQSREYIDQWKGRKKEDDNARQFRIQSCHDELQQKLTALSNQGAYATNGMNDMNGDRDGDVNMGENGDAAGEQVVNIPLELDDELADIPADMRATVAEEIKAFRDRSNRRDIERLRREEEVEQEERRRTGAAPRASRLASPPPSTSAANGIPVGPRGQQGVHGAPSGPKGFRGAQIPSDYANGVAFVPGAGPNGQGVTVSLNREDEDAEESDEELERRRQDKKNAELEKQYQEQVRRWQIRERQRGAAQEREKIRQDDEKRDRDQAKQDMLVRLAEWNDDEEADKARHPYYRDRSGWIRQRERDREHERREDERDRKEEEREKADERRRENEARGMADEFLGSMGMEAESKEASGPAPFKISLGGAAAKTKQPQAAAAPKRTMADVLEDEEDAAAAGMKRPELKPLQDTSTVPTSGQDLTEDEKGHARQQLASEIPTDTEALFSHPIKWECLGPALLDSQIRPFVERKVVEYLGVQEDLIVDAVIQSIKDRKEAKTLVDELEGPLEQESEVLVKKVWRLLVFWGECESRGLSQ
ncbi:hypothetical protein M409DRAFT_67878 [Zasmidium cellare ATCC 36951]|uniref:PWI domain-containing protein n=1 Tax=Zasmidium cellare ATCC 36951 TaxID=1080233 RepID=A0A6A6CAX3_ZASCE|nr:uncharacterized protein M409DRAFT_67878 [Zasmidium cellare ATCC 36951]KAF2164347.1 hypothetical protein M409DRAFT_67878 [Zasmidium cellare ATCC 36951]